MLDEYSSLVREHGGDPEALLRLVGLTTADVADPDRMIPISSLTDLFDLTVAATGCRHFGARLAQRHDLATYLGTLGRVVWAAPDLGTAIRRFTGHVGVHAETSRWSLDIEEGLARLRNESAASGAASQRSIHAAGHNLVLVSRLLRAVSGDRLHFSLVHFAAREPQDAHEYRAIFDCPVLFDQHVDALIFHSSDLELALPTADDQLSRILLRHSDLRPSEPATDLVAEVERLVEKNLLAGVSGVDVVARFLPYSRSTLQQRLTDLGTSHQMILDKVRDRWAKDRLVRSDVSIAELARTLRYGSADTFSVAFKRRNGLSPSRWRSRSRIETLDGTAR